MTRRRILVATSALMPVVLIFAALGAMSGMANRPENLGLSDGKLRPCPSTPNCVCSEESAGDAAMAPIPFTGTRAEAMTRLIAVIEQMPRTVVVQKTDDYLHVEFTSLIFRFTDDVEFRIDEAASQIHFRSASRVGRSDLGANRKRMKQIKAKFQDH